MPCVCPWIYPESSFGSLAVCGHRFGMGRAKLLSSDKIAVITALCKEGKSNKEIVESTGLKLRSIQWWTKKFHDAVDNDPPLQKRST